MKKIISIPHLFWLDTERGPSLGKNSIGVEKMESHDVKLPHYSRWWHAWQLEINTRFSKEDVIAISFGQPFTYRPS